MNQATDRDVLLLAAAKVRAGWTTEVMARDHAGRPTPYIRPEAVQFCAFGAILRVEHDLGVETHAVERLATYLNVKYIHGWNDLAGSAEAAAVAIEAAANE